MTYISPYLFVLAFFFTQNFFAEKLDVSTTSKESYSLPFSKFNVGNEPKEKQDTSMGTNGVHDKRALQVNENTSEVLSDLLQSSDWNTYLPYRWGYDIVSLERLEFHNHSSNKWRLSKGRPIPYTDRRQLVGLSI